MPSRPMAGLAEATAKWRALRWRRQLCSLDAWMLSADLADTGVLAAATASASAAFAPFTATVSHVELIRTAPLELLFSGPLAAG